MARRRPSALSTRRTAALSPWRLAATSRVWLVPAHALLVRPCAARRSVAAPDVTETPADLRRGVGLPVRAGAGHLGARQRLGYPVSTRRVRRGGTPAALRVPQRYQAGHLAGRPAVGAEHGRGDLLRRP